MHYLCAGHLRLAGCGFSHAALCHFSSILCVSVKTVYTVYARLYVYNVCSMHIQLVYIYIVFVPTVTTTVRCTVYLEIYMYISIVLC